MRTVVAFRVAQQQGGLVPARPSSRDRPFTPAGPSSRRAGPRRRCRRGRAVARSSARRCTSVAPAPSRRHVAAPMADRSSAVKCPPRTRPPSRPLCRVACGSRRCPRPAPPRAPCALTRSVWAFGRRTGSFGGGAASSTGPPSPCSGPSSTRSTPSCRGRRRPARPPAATYRSSRGRWARRAARFRSWVSCSVQASDGIFRRGWPRGVGPLAVGTALPAPGGSVFLPQPHNASARWRGGGTTSISGGAGGAPDSASPLVDAAYLLVSYMT